MSRLSGQGNKTGRNAPFLFSEPVKFVCVPRLSYTCRIISGGTKMKLRYILAVLCICAVPVQAEIYKSVDENGHVTYSSTPIKGGKKIILEPLPTMVPPARARSTATPEDFPRVDGETQKRRDDTRRKILEDELAAEQKLLEEAR